MRPTMLAAVIVSLGVASYSSASAKSLNIATNTGDALQEILDW
jgi:hypothetical protein